jgi:hypothetical protein
MLKKTLVITLVLVAATTVAASAQTSSFQFTCSNIDFAYSGNDAAVTAVCLRRDGTPNKTQVLIKGISNQDGKLVQGSGASSFQKSCGNIQIEVDGPYVTLSALCRTMSGRSNETSIPLGGISNQNGQLTY